MRVFVTGGHGFVGTYLVEHLRALGDDVTAPHQNDVDLGDQSTLTAAVLAASPDAVIHLAALAHVGESWKDPARTFDVNAVGTLHLLEATRRVEPAPRVLLIGSAEVYGPVRPEDLPLTEDHKLNPVTPYAVSKVAAEYLGVQYHLGFGVPVVRARSFNHIGPGQAGRFVVADIAGRIAEAIKSGDTSPIKVGNLSARRDYTDVRDVVRAYRLLVTEGTAGEAYNVCSGVDVSVETLAQKLLALADVDLRVEVDPALVRPVDVPVLVGSNARLRAATGWQPEISLDDTLRDVLAALL
ncbi:MAG TPA: GDP-mannose 4,6-dehydratase [Acidimicrobiales bacterium]|nr:GDP-mannose 4,6-dehydratase [Acidimicrobiales bacterium]